MCGMKILCNEKLGFMVFSQGLMKVIFGRSHHSRQFDVIIRNMSMEEVCQDNGGL